jgi:hypothetical protein
MKKCSLERVYCILDGKKFPLVPMGVSLLGLRTLDPMLSPLLKQAEKILGARVWEGESEINADKFSRNFRR